MDALSALEKFKASGNSKPVKRFKSTPSLKFSKAGDEFIRGVYLERKEVQSKAGKSIINIRLLESNATFTKSNGEGFEAVTVAEGDIVSVWAPTALDSLIQNIEVGSEVFIMSHGKVKEMGKSGKVVEYYKFDVRSKAE